MTAYQNITGSGYLNNPVRTVIIDRDNRPGSYPTHASPIDLRRPESAGLMTPFRDDLTIATPRARATARVVIGELPTPGSTLTLTGLANPMGPATVSSVFEFQATDVPSTTPGAYTVSLAGVLSTAPDPGLPGLTPKQLTRRRSAERLIEAINAAAGSLITARPGPIPGEVLLEQRVPGSAGNLSNSTTAFGLTVTPFAGAGDGTVRYPFGVGVVDGDPTLVSNEPIRRVVRGVRSGTLDVPTSGRAALLDAPSDGHPYVAHAPFDETGAQAAFGINTGGSALYGTQARLDDPFITQGSVSGTLDEPLGAKDKIEIDLTPAEETTLFQNDGSTSQNFPMTYFNFVTRRWEPIGFGNGVSFPYPTTLQDLLEDQYLGFSQGWGNYHQPSSDLNISILDPQLADQFTGEKRVFQETGWFSPTDTFGFPLHPKYHATGSQQLDCGVMIDRPFLLEKMVYQFSASMPDLMSAFTSDEYRGGGGAFFILNQRKANPDPGQEKSYTNVYVARTSVESFSTPQDGGTDGPSGDFWVLPYDNGGIPRTMQLSPSGPNVYVDTVRDLVTFARIGTVWPTYDEEIENLIEPGFPHPASFMDLAIEVPVSGTFSGEYMVAAPIRAPSQNSAVSTISLGTTVSPNNIIGIYSAKDSSTRNSIDVATGRAHNGEFFGPEISYRVNGFGVTADKQIFAPKKDSINSPYLIRPGDRLVFGWQASNWFNLETVVLGGDETRRKLSLLPGKGKLTLYGSYLQDDKPVHDIYKDQLNSDAAHETIPSGPWVLDRFESDPQMMFSSSMREEHVTGTMLTRNADGSLSVTSVSDLDIGGVRAVSARASDGDLGQRWSFFRNNRLIDAEEQYYDSMQPNPLDVLFSDPNVKSSVDGFTGYVPLMLPGETFFYFSSFPNFTAAVNTHSNRSLFLRYPFQEEYAGFARVKKINSSVLAGREVPAFISSGSSPDTVTLTTTKINSAIFFVTGSTGTPGPTTLSGFLRPGGLFKRGPSSASAIGGFIFPVTDRTSFETNPTRTSLLPAEPAVDDPVAGVNYWMSRFMGCFGDGFLRMCQFRTIDESIDPTQFFFVQSLIYRGAKHGLVNPTPLFSSAIFNGTQFGQPRDLMEQRQYTRFSLTDSSLTDAAVEVVFIDRSVTPDINGARTNNVVSGSATNSSNISPFATSEHPYDDARADSRLIWDRDTPLPEEALAF